MQKEGKQSTSISRGHFDRYLEYTTSILSLYKGNEPFHSFLKKYFSSSKKHGSRDRKLISSLCYNYFRVGYSVSSNENFDKKILLSAFLCETNFSPLLETHRPDWNAFIQIPLSDKLKIVEKEFDLKQIFPFSNQLSDEINFRKFSLSFLTQPKLFIRIRPGCKAAVINKLRGVGLKFEELNDNCLAFGNNEKVSGIIEIDKEAVVQDYNSQRTLDLVKEAMIDSKSEISIWDCCAGSGGKSILAFDTLKNINLTVSDKRSSILENLRARFKIAGIRNYNFFINDLQLSSSAPVSISGSFDLIIADVPCTGSGTWSRTPEQLTYFHKKDISKYVSLQRNIIENTVSRLKDKGYFLYITCSVFKKENEENIGFIQKEFHLSLLRMGYLKGYEIQADTMFTALLRKSQ
ncbi:MAG: Fmu (Sun) domain-containing protein [Ginsengibacter sp.]